MLAGTDRTPVKAKDCILPNKGVSLDCKMKPLGSESYQ